MTGFFCISSIIGSQACKGTAYEQACKAIKPAQKWQASQACTEMAMQASLQRDCKASKLSKGWQGKQGKQACKGTARQASFQRDGKASKLAKGLQGKANKPAKDALPCLLSRKD
jgi:hypothetical protein